MEDKEANNLHNQNDVNPTTQLDQLINETDQKKMPDTNGTGANRSVPTAGSVSIKEDEKDNDAEIKPEEQPDSPG